MRKLMTGDIRRGSKSRMRRWRKFTCGGTTSTVSGTMKSRPTLVLLFLNTALVVSSVYDLPFGRKWITHHGWRWGLLGNWQVAGILTAQTGSPFTVNLAAPQSGSAIAAFGNRYRPDALSNPYMPGPALANPNPACHITISQGGLAADVVDHPGSWFNSCAFLQPPAGQFGNAGRNIMTGPGLENLDFSLYKNLMLRKESHRLQLRAEVFDLLNHPNFDIPNRVFGSPNFGQVLSGNAYGNKPPRQIQLGIKRSEEHTSEL